MNFFNQNILSPLNFGASFIKKRQSGLIQQNLNHTKINTLNPM